METSASRYTFDHTGTETSIELKLENGTVKLAAGNIIKYINEFEENTIHTGIINDIAKTISGIYRLYIDISEDFKSNIITEYLDNIKAIKIVDSVEEEISVNDLIDISDYNNKIHQLSANKDQYVDFVSVENTSEKVKAYIDNIVYIKYMEAPATISECEKGIPYLDENINGYNDVEVRGRLSKVAKRVGGYSGEPSYIIIDTSVKNHSENVPIYNQSNYIIKDVQVLAKNADEYFKMLQDLLNPTDPDGEEADENQETSETDNSDDNSTEENS